MVRWLWVALGTLICTQALGLPVEMPSNDSPPTGAGVPTAAPHGVVDIKAWEKSRRSSRPKRDLAFPKQQKLRVKSGSALVIDQSNGTTLYAKNSNVRLPIASITKIMTAMVVLDQNSSLEEKIEINMDDVDRLRFSFSRLTVGASLSRGELLQLALMASENRAAAALARAFPGGTDAFVDAMNAKAQQLGMTNTYFTDSSGLDRKNVSTAADLAKMVTAAYEYELIRQLTTTSSYIVAAENYRPQRFRNTNVLVYNKTWDIGLSKTGFINEAGHCLVMQTLIATRPLIIVLLDAQGKMTRVGDANRIKRWLEKAQFGKQRIS